MVRVPKRLRDELAGYALTLTKYLDVKQQGNHDDPRDWAPPLWQVIQLLLDRDKDHRKRSRSNSVNREAPVKTTTEGGIATGQDVDVAS